MPEDRSDNEAKSASAARQLRRWTSMAGGLTKRLFTTARSGLIKPFPRPDVLPDFQLVDDRLILVENLLDAPTASSPLSDLLRRRVRFDGPPPALVEFRHQASIQSAPPPRVSPPPFPHGIQCRIV